jgi:hypothetical protein
MRAFHGVVTSAAEFVAKQLRYYYYYTYRRWAQLMFLHGSLRL